MPPKNIPIAGVSGGANVKNGLAMTMTIDCTINKRTVYNPIVIKSFAANFLYSFDSSPSD